MWTLVYKRHFWAMVCTGLALSGCSNHAAPASKSATSEPAVSAVDAGTLHAIEPSESPTAAAPSDVSSASDAGVADAAARDAAPAKDVSPPKSTPGGPIRVFNIGMHIGGGPNDDITKEPIYKSVAPHFAEVGQCFPAGAAAPIDFGVDLTIEAKGGKAQVERPRTSLRDDTFISCVVGVFQGIDFLPPRLGKTVVSYSLRFAAAKR